jgi:hypothetical protein
MKTFLPLTALLLAAPSFAAEFSGTCKNSAIKAALAVEQISTNVNGCEEDCDRSVKMLSVTQTKEWNGQDHIDIWSSYEIATASDRGSPRGTYSVTVSSYDLGICRIREVKQIK